MPTDVLISPEEYLHTSFPDLDKEYVHGEIVERGLPDLSHSKTQLRFCLILSRLTAAHKLFPFPELRLRLEARVVRIPDVSVFLGREPVQQVPNHPPFIAIEIVSEDDRYPNILKKLEEHRRFGVTHIWLVDPRLMRLSEYGETGLREVKAFLLPDFDLKITLADLGLC